VNVLIIEDFAPEAFIFAALLKRVARRVEIAHTMAEAWEWLKRKNGFDVVVLDLALPDSTRQMSLDSIREIRGTGRKVVVLTGHVDADTEATAIACGADACFYKGNPDLASCLQARLKQP